MVPRTLARFPRARPIVGLAFVAALTACSGSTEPGTEPSEIELDASRTIVIDDSVRVTPKVVDRRGRTILDAAVTWQSLDPSIATVDENGHIAAIRLGATTIRARSGSASADMSVSVAPHFVDIAVGEMHTCGIAGDGRTFCWGGNPWGQLGRTTPHCGALGIPCDSRPRLIAGSHQLVEISAGGGHSCGLTSTGAAYCWGLNASGALGAPTSGQFTQSVTAVNGSVRFRMLALGRFHSCGIATTGDAYCWGEDYQGQLGAGVVAPETCVNWFSMTVPCSTAPLRVAGGHTFVTLTASDRATCGLTTQGNVYCWGLEVGGSESENCQGGERMDCARTPVLATTETYAGLAVGSVHTCALRQDGGLRCWGANYFGMFGDGTRQSSTTPVVAANGFLFATVTAGSVHTCGLNIGGVALCWGNDELGQTGAAIIAADRLSPVVVGGGHIFDWINSGGSAWTTCGVTVEGRAYCWGDGRFGQRGDETLLQKLAGPRPVSVPRSSD